MRAPWHPLRKPPVGDEPGSFALPSLRFEVERDACCELCNPLSIADYETYCVRVVSSRQELSRTFCEDCVRHMATVLQVRAKRKRGGVAKAAPAHGRRKR